MKQAAILTFDYELFLGKKSGTILNSVIRPTQTILEILQRENAKAIFFVDATWLLFLKKNSGSDLKIVSDQIKDIVRQGSSVELHLHPQWIDAYQKDGTIYFKTFENYSFSAFKPDEILDLFRSSTALLESITRQKIRCYRAGGSCIEPFNQVKRAFDICKIKFDFSSFPGVYLRSGHIYDFDYRDIPDLMFFPFEDSVKKPTPDGNYFEFPTSTYNNNAFYRLLNIGLLKLRNDKIGGDGEGIQRELTLISRLVSKKLGFSRTFLTLDQMDTHLFQHILWHHFRNRRLIVILSHPKTFSGNSALNLTHIARYYNTMNSDDLDPFMLKENEMQ